MSWSLSPSLAILILASYFNCVLPGIPALPFQVADVTSSYFPLILPPPLESFFLG